MDGIMCCEAIVEAGADWISGAGFTRESLLKDIEYFIKHLEAKVNWEDDRCTYPDSLA